VHPDHAGTGIFFPSPPRSTRTLIGSEQDTSFVRGDRTVHGTVRVPEVSDALVPGAVIIAGSGPTDRDGNSAVPGYESLRFDTHVWLADVLAEHGVASLRYDKFGSGTTGAGPFADQPDAANDCTFEELFVQPARDALAHLAEQAGVNPSRMLFVGHSEGGMVALAAGVDPHGGVAPSGLVLVEPQYGRIIDILGRQLRAVLDDTAGIEPADAATLAEWMDAGLTEIRSSPPPWPQMTTVPLPDADGVTAAIQAQIASIVFGRLRTRIGASGDEFDPVALAARWDHPSSVLITCGTADFNTPLNSGGPPGSGVDALAAAFADGVAELVVIDGMIHELRDLAGADPRAIGPADIATLAFSSALHTSLGGFVDQWGTA